MLRICSLMLGGENAVLHPPNRHMSPVPFDQEDLALLCLATFSPARFRAPLTPAHAISRARAPRPHLSLAFVAGPQEPAAATGSPAARTRVKSVRLSCDFPARPRAPRTRFSPAAPPQPRAHVREVSATFV